MEECPTIYLMQGATTIVDLDLSDFAMQGGSVVLTMREKGGEVINTWEFDRPNIHEVVFGDEFTAGLKVSKLAYEYDIMWLIDGTHRAQCAPSRIEVSRTVGGWSHEADARG